MMKKRKKYLEKLISSLAYGGYDHLHDGFDEASWNINRFPEYLYQIDPTWEMDLNWYNDMKSFIVHNIFSKWGPPTPLDANWHDWLNRTGELPPDFDKMPTIPLLPDPLIKDEGGANIPITTREQWMLQREWIKEQAQKWILGTIPPAPDNLKYNLKT